MVRDVNLPYSALTEQRDFLSDRIQIESHSIRLFIEQQIKDQRSIDLNRGQAQGLQPIV